MREVCSGTQVTKIRNNGQKIRFILFINECVFICLCINCLALAVKLNTKSISYFDKQRQNCTLYIYLELPLSCTLFNKVVSRG
jgi:hypothetical protein